MKNSLWEKLLVINFDYKLNFAKYIEDICQKISRKLHVLAKFRSYLTSSKNVFQ